MKFTQDKRIHSTLTFRIISPFPSKLPYIYFFCFVPSAQKEQSENFQVESSNKKFQTNLSNGITN